MYCVVHGGVNQNLRKLSANYLSSLPFDGFAIGGSLGKDREELMGLLDYLMPMLPTDKPNHLLGIADITSILQVMSPSPWQTANQLMMMITMLTKCLHRDGLTRTSPPGALLSHGDDNDDDKGLTTCCTALPW